MRDSIFTWGLAIQARKKNPYQILIIILTFEFVMMRRSLMKTGVFFIFCEGFRLH